MGKTFLLRLLLLIAALDPRAELHAYDLKGTGDLSPLEPVAHRYRAGDDDEDIAYAARRLPRAARGAAPPHQGDPRPAAATCARRTRSPPSWPSQEVARPAPDRDRRRRVPGHVRAPRATAAEFEDICTDLVKRGPAPGIDLVLATQRPDAKSIPTGDQRERRAADLPEGHGPDRERHGARHLRLQERHPRHHVVLPGQGHLLPRRRRRRRRGSSAASTSTARTPKKIAARARAARIAAGRLTGYARGPRPRTATTPASRARCSPTCWPRSATPTRRGRSPSWTGSPSCGPPSLRPMGRTADEHGQGDAARRRAQALRHHHQAGVGHRPDDGKGANQMGVHRDWIADSTYRT